MLERDNLFAVGDEFQSIYGFRHADVTIFRGRARTLGAGGVRRLRANFRSREELLDVLDGAFRPVFGEAFEPLVAGVKPAPGGVELRLFDPDHVDRPLGAHDEPPVELLVTDTRGWDDVADLGLELPGEQPWRRAEARLVAQRLREEVDRGRRPGEIAVLVRAASSLRLLEQALEERGLPTYVVGGRGYWSQEQVRDGLAYLSVLANPRDEEALHAVLASPFAGVGADALVLAARAGAQAGGAWAALKAAFAGADAGAAAAPPWVADLPEGDRAALGRLVGFLAAERLRAERLPAEVLLERAVAHTGYDLAVLGRPGGERRLANLRKLMRLAREFERAEGRDLRAFLAFAATQDLAQAREGEAALESEGLEAVRLMTIHRAKGLEFPVVCVADLGRLGPGGAPPLLLGADGRRIGIRLRSLGAPQGVAALDHEALAAERARAEDEEERRLLYVAMTRARELLLLSGGLNAARPAAPRPGGAPLSWIVPALLDEPARLASEHDFRADRTWEGRPARLRVRVSAPGAGLLTPVPAAPPPAAPGTALPVPPTLGEVPRRPDRVAGLPTRLSYSSLGLYTRCGYRWYLQRVLGLREVAPPAPEITGVEPLAGDAAPADVAAPEDAGPAAPALDARTRGSIVHALLEDLDLRRPRRPTREEAAAASAAAGTEPTAAELDDIAGLVDAFATSELRARLARARGVRRESPFSFPLEPGARGLLVHGIVDVVAQEDGGTLVVDYKSDRLGDLDPEALTLRDYAGQRLVYALAALRGGAPRVEVAHCYLERPDEPATAVFTAADADALAERLVRSARGLLAGDFAPTATPHRDLCGTCPGRAALCSHPESRTLRPLEPGAA
jgi:ATP-dependent exoDNAse (exonuclease V) beta subunit